MMIVWFVNDNSPETSPYRRGYEDGNRHAMEEYQREYEEGFNEGRTRHILSVDTALGDRLDTAIKHLGYIKAVSPLWTEEQENILCLLKDIKKIL